MTKIAVAKGDGIGPEIMEAVIQIFKAAQVPLEYEFVDMGKWVFDKGMQIRTEAIKNIMNDLSLNNTNASLPRICENVAVIPLDFGGVSGKKKLNKPKTTEAPAAILKVKTN